MEEKLEGIVSHISKDDRRFKVTIDGTNAFAWLTSREGSIGGSLLGTMEDVKEGERWSFKVYTASKGYKTITSGVKVIDINDDTKEGLEPEVSVTKPKKTTIKSDRRNASFALAYSKDVRCALINRLGEDEKDETTIERARKFELFMDM